MMGYGAVHLFESTANFFLGFCAFVAAAFVFQRSRRAALFVALAGLPFMLTTPLEWVLMNASIPALGHGVIYIIDAFNILQHVGFFGGLALAMRTIAVERPA